MGMPPHGVQDRAVLDGLGPQRPSRVIDRQPLMVMQRCRWERNESAAERCQGPSQQAVDWPGSQVRDCYVRS